jgi:hypothetical protein
MERNATLNPVPPKSLAAALAHVAQGGRLVVPTYTRVTVIEAKHLAAWDKAGKPLLTEDGDGYRMRSGKGSVYLIPGLLKFA